jgi:hypothetical protein
MFMAEKKPGQPQRRRLMPGQGRLIAASVLVMVGAFLPWLYTAFSQPKHPQFLWLFVVGFVALAGGLIPNQKIAYWHSVVTAVVTLGLTAWYLFQLVVEIIAKVGFGGWMLGPGLVLTVAGGVLAIQSARTLATVQAVRVEA